MHFPSSTSVKFISSGFAEDRDDTGAPLLIDAHGTPVASAVWSLYRRARAALWPDTDADRMGQRRP